MINWLDAGRAAAPTAFSSAPATFARSWHLAQDASVSASTARQTRRRSLAESGPGYWATRPAFCPQTRRRRVRNSCRTDRPGTSRAAVRGVPQRPREAPPLAHASRQWSATRIRLRTIGRRHTGQAMVRAARSVSRSVAYKRRLAVWQHWQTLGWRWAHSCRCPRTRRAFCLRGRFSREHAPTPKPFRGKQQPDQHVGDAAVVERPNLP